MKKRLRCHPTTTPTSSPSPYVRANSAASAKRLSPQSSAAAAPGRPPYSAHRNAVCRSPQRSERAARRSNSGRSSSESPISSSSCVSLALKALLCAVSKWPCFRQKSARRRQTATVFIFSAYSRANFLLGFL